jgi:hypothetical protein
MGRVGGKPAELLESLLQASQRLIEYPRKLSQFVIRVVVGQPRVACRE